LRTWHLPEATRIVEPGGKIFINANGANPHGKLPSASDLEFEVTKDDEHRTDLYVTKSSVEAVSAPKVTAKRWGQQLTQYDETAKHNYETAGRDFARMINRIERSTGRQMDAQVVARMGENFAEASLDAIMQAGATSEQGMQLLVDREFQQAVIKEIGYLTGIDLKPLAPLRVALEAEAGDDKALQLPPLNITERDTKNLHCRSLPCARWQRSATIFKRIPINRRPLGYCYPLPRAQRGSAVRCTPSGC